VHESRFGGDISKGDGPGGRRLRAGLPSDSGGEHAENEHEKRAHDQLFDSIGLEDGSFARRLKPLGDLELALGFFGASHLLQELS
jgi:hypothetical protein